MKLRHYKTKLLVQRTFPDSLTFPSTPPGSVHHRLSHNASESGAIPDGLPTTTCAERWSGRCRRTQSWSSQKDKSLRKPGDAAETRGRFAMRAGRANEIDLRQRWMLPFLRFCLRLPLLSRTRERRGREGAAWLRFVCGAQTSRSRTRNVGYCNKAHMPTAATHVDRV